MEKLDTIKWHGKNDGHKSCETMKFGVFVAQMTETSLKWGWNLELCKKTFTTFPGGLKIGV